MKFKIFYNKMCKNSRQIFKVDMRGCRHNFIATSKSDCGKEEEREIIKAFCAYKQDSVMMIDKIFKYGCDLCQLREIIRNNVLNW